MKIKGIVLSGEMLLSRRSSELQRAGCRKQHRFSDKEKGEVTRFNKVLSKNLFLSKSN